MIFNFFIVIYFKFMLVRNKPKRREGFIKTQSLKSIQFRKKLDLGELSQEFSAF